MHVEARLGSCCVHFYLGLTGSSPGTLNLPLWCFLNTRFGFCIWKHICLLSPFIQIASKWFVGNGKSTSLWLDRWIDHGPIAYRIPDFKLSPLDKVSTIDEDGSSHFPNDIPYPLQQFLQRAHQIQLPSEFLIR